MSVRRGAVAVLSVGVVALAGGSVASAATEQDGVGAGSDRGAVAEGLRGGSALKLKLMDEDGIAKAGKSRLLVVSNRGESALKVRVQRANISKWRKSHVKSHVRKWLPVAKFVLAAGETEKLKVPVRVGVHGYRAKGKSVSGSSKAEPIVSNKVPLKGTVLGATSCFNLNGHLNSCVTVQNAALGYTGPNTLSPVGFTWQSNNWYYGYVEDSSGNEVSPKQAVSTTTGIPAGSPWGTARWAYRNWEGSMTGIDTHEFFSVDISVIPTADQVDFRQYQAYWGGSNLGECPRTYGDASFIRCTVTDPPAETMDTSTTYRVGTAPTTIQLTNNLGDSDVTLVGNPQLTGLVNDPKGQSANTGAIADTKTAYFGLYRSNSAGNGFSATYTTNPSGKFGAASFVLNLVIDTDTFNRTLSTCTFQKANQVTASCDLTATTNASGAQTVSVNFSNA